MTGLSKGLSEVLAMSSSSKILCVMFHGQRGKLACCGFFDPVSGQYNRCAGLGTGPNTMRAVSFGSDFDIASFSAFDEGVCAVSTSGGLKCMHNKNNNAYLGLPAVSGADIPLLTVSTSQNLVGVSVAPTGRSVCALFADYTAKCWGMGVSGNGVARVAYTANSTIGNTAPVALPGGYGALSVSANDGFACAILTSYRVTCWGINSPEGRLGTGDNVAGIYGPPTTIYDPPFTLVDFGGSGSLQATTVATGQNHACVIFSTGQVKCWGANSSGELGIGDFKNRGSAATDMGDALPFVDLGGRKARSLALGNSFTCITLDDLSVKCFGKNDAAQLGLGTVSATGAGTLGINLADSSGLHFKQGWWFTYTSDVLVLPATLWSFTGGAVMGGVMLGIFAVLALAALIQDGFWSFWAQKAMWFKMLMRTVDMASNVLYIAATPMARKSIALSLIVLMFTAPVANTAMMLWGRQVDLSRWIPQETLYPFAPLMFVVFGTMDFASVDLFLGCTCLLPAGLDHERFPLAQRYDPDGELDDAPPMVRWLAKPLQGVYGWSSRKLEYLLLKSLCSVVGLAWLALSASMVAVIYSLFLTLLAIKTLAFLFFVGSGTIAHPLVMSWYAPAEDPEADDAGSADHLDVRRQALKVFVASCTVEMILEDLPQMALQTFNSVSLGQAKNVIFLVSLVSGAFFILRELYEVAGMLICEKTGLFNLDRAWQPDKMFGAPAAAPKIPHSVTPPTLERMSRASGTDANTSAKTWAHYLSLDKYLWKAKDSE